MDQPQSKPPSCTQCAHYYITHDASFLHGCRALNFKSKRLPQHAVFAASHTACLAFEPKAPRAGAAPHTPKD